jgi:hypothetical protein
LPAIKPDELKGGRVNQAPMQFHRFARLHGLGHFAIIGIIMIMTYGLFIYSREQAQKRSRDLGYCDRAVPSLIQKTETRSGGRQRQSLVATSAARGLALALPRATSLQRERLSEQINEFANLYRYHCSNMQDVSDDYQALLFVANSSGVLVLGMMVVVFRHIGKGELVWPYTVLLACACIFGMTLLSIQTFDLNGNMVASRAMAEQTAANVRSMSTAVANQAYQGPRGTVSLSDPQKLFSFMRLIDGQLSQVDRSNFTISDKADNKGAQLFYNKMSSLVPLPGH